MKLSYSLIENVNLILLGISIAFIRLPPLYIIPVQHSLFMSHTISRILIVCSLSITLWFHFIKNNQIKLNKPLFYLILIWFLSQSISVVKAHDLSLFFRSYKDIVFALLLFFATYLTVKNKNIYFFLKILLSVSLLHLILQLFAYFYPAYFYMLFGQIFYDKYWQFLEYQYSRARFFGDALDEALISIAFFYLIASKRILTKSGMLIFLGIVTFITFASNWRSKTIVYIFALLSSGLIYINFFKKIIFIFSFVVLLVFISNIISRETIGYNILDRFVYGGAEEVATIEARYNYWESAKDIGLSSPLFGVGLGHYYDYLSAKTQLLTLSSYIDRYRAFITIEDPHNILFSTFATTGFFGLISLCLLLLYFLYSDYKTLIKKQYVINSLISVFWSIFIYSLFNPWLYFSYLGFLWFIRGSIEALKYDHGKK